MAETLALEGLLLETYPVIRKVDNALANKIGKALNLNKRVDSITLSVTVKDFEIPFNTNLEDPGVYRLLLKIGDKDVHGEIELLDYVIEEIYSD